MLRLGTTTFETKSGYGLSREAELRALRLGRGSPATRSRTRRRRPCSRTSSPRASTPTAGWTWSRRCCYEARAIADIAALDIYVESVAFTNEHLRRMGGLAAQHGLDLRAHVEQFASSAVGARRARGRRALGRPPVVPAPDDVAPLAAAECAAVLLPGAEFLGDEQQAPGRELADAGAICVLATDLNPGTSPVVSLPLIIGLAVRRYGWTVREALLAVTLNAAWVLRRSDVAGSLEVGKRADLLVLDGPVEHVPYRLGHEPVPCAFANGELRYVRPGAEARVQR